MNGLRKYIHNLCELGKAKAARERKLRDFVYFEAVRREIDDILNI